MAAAINSRKKILHKIFTIASKLLPRKNKSPRLPWIIMLGEKGSGKTTLLKNTALTLLNPAHQELYQSLQQTGICDWHFTQQGIILDLASDYFFHDSDENPCNELWEELLILIKKSPYKHDVRGIVFVINLQEILVQNAERNQRNIKRIQFYLAQLQAIFHQTIPVQVIFNKVDLLAGFVEFFGDLTQDERCQYWGLHLQAEQVNINLTQRLQQKFAELLVKLNERVIWRLHQEHHLPRRIILKDFPLQFESIKNIVIDFIYAAFNDYYLAEPKIFGGIYFTSAIQQGAPLDRLLQPLSNAFALQPLKMLTHANSEKAYFSQTLFDQILFKTPPLTAVWQKFAWPQWSAACISGILVVATILYCNHGYQERITQLNNAEQALATYQYFLKQQHDNHDLKTILASLDPLQQINHALITQTSGITQHFAEQPIIKLQHNAKQLYQQLLQHDLLPQLRDLAYDQLYHTALNDPLAIYHHLNVYLMFGHPEQLDQKVFDEWLAQTWKQQNYDDVSLQVLRQQLQHIFAGHVAPLPLNQRIVNSAQITLAKLSNAQLALIIINDKIHEPDVALLDPAQTALQLPLNKIPYIYTAKGFADVNDNLINAVAKEVLSGSWLQNDDNPPMPNAENINRLAQQIKIIYQLSYAQLWQYIFTGTQIHKATNLTELNNLLLQLTGNAAPLANYLKTVDLNTAPIRLGLIATPSIANAPNLRLQLEVLHSLLLSPSGNDVPELKPLFDHINSLQQIVGGVSSADDPLHAAWQYTSQRWKNPPKDDALIQLMSEAQQLPEPLQSWLGQLTAQTWQTLVNETYTFLNRQWQQQIFTEYQTRLLHHYPLDQNAFEQVSLEDFTHFFAPQGTLNQFINQYLAPFITVNPQSWSLTSCNGLTLPINHTTLLELQLASYITKIYFPENDNNLSASFVLQPVGLDNNAARFTFDYPDKKMTYEHNAPPAQLGLHWPSSEASVPTLTVTLRTLTGQEYSQSATGPWALFKLLHQANIQTTNDPRRFLLSFTFDTFTVKYILNAADALNPFLPHVIDEFTLAEKL